MSKFIEPFIQKWFGKSRPKIGFGLQSPDREILESLRKSKRYAKIILIGPEGIKNVKGFEKVISSNPEKKLAEMLVKKEVKGIIRGTVDDFETFEAYQKLVGKNKTRGMVIFALLEDAFGRQFFISEGSNPAGWTKKEKIKSCEKIIEFMKRLGLEPKVGCLAGIRDKTYKRKGKKEKKWPMDYLNQTYKDAESVAKYFNKREILTKNYTIELDAAVKDNCNIIIPPNGMIGNQIFRALCLIGKGKMLTCSRVNIPDIYEDNSRNEKDFSYHLKWIVSWINSKK